MRGSFIHLDLLIIYSFFLSVKIYIALGIVMLVEWFAGLLDNALLFGGLLAHRLH